VYADGEMAGRGAHATRGQDHGGWCDRGRQPRGDRTMKPAHTLDVALVAMPFTCADLPSAALSALSAYARRERPQYAIDTHSEFVDVSVMIGDRLYAAIANEANEIGMLLYMPLIYPHRLDAVREHFRKWVAKRAPSEPVFRDPGFDPERTFFAIIDTLTSHVADLAAR